jgi:hypothetical protein
MILPMVFRMAHKMCFDAPRGVAVFGLKHVSVDAHRDLDVRVSSSTLHDRHTLSPLL